MGGSIYSLSIQTCAAWSHCRPPGAAPRSHRTSCIASNPATSLNIKAFRVPVFSSGRTKNKAAGFVETQVQQFLDDQIAHVEEGTPQIPGPTQVAFQWRLGPDVPSAARSSAVQAPASTRSSFGASSGPEAEGRLCLRGAD